MYQTLKSLLLELLRLPKEPPHIPADGHVRTKVYRASPRYLAYQYLRLALGLSGSFFGFTGLSVAAMVRWRGVGVLVALGLMGVWCVKALFLYGVTRLAYELRYYLVTDKSLRIREGIFTLREVTLTYGNVQNVSLQQGPLERLFGFSNVVVETAGGGSSGPKAELSNEGHTGRLLGIDNAEEVRDLIRNHLGQAPAQAGLGDADGAHEEAALGPEELPVLREILSEVRGLRSYLGP